MSNEAKLHEATERFRGEWEMETDWGVIRVAFRPLRIGYGTAKGTPDEIIIMNMSFPLFGEWLTLQAPILLEMEEEGGLPASLEDLRKFSERTRSGEQESHLELPMMVIGKIRKSSSIDTVLKAVVKLKEVPKSTLNL